MEITKALNEMAASFASLAVKAEDIMIGNYFEYDNKIVFIAEILKTKLVTIYDGYGLEKGTTLGCLRPIPLTEDILLKAGFKLDNNKNYWLSSELDKHLDLIFVDGYYYPQLVQEPELSCDSLSIVSLNRISALHELQNLFKILTGNDLKIEV